MNRILIGRLALRYLRGKRSGNAVPILSRISMAAIAVGSCAMIVLFSVFNGFEGLVKELYKAFYPEIKITAARGKFFQVDDGRIKAARAVKGVQDVTGVLEDNVLINSENQHITATLKGIDSNYLKVNDINPYIVAGTDTVTDGPVPTAVMGVHIANMIGADANNVFSNIELYYPNTKLNGTVLNPDEAFQTLTIKPAGEFKIQDEFDSKYVLAPINAVRNLFQEDNRLSSLEISLAPKSDDKTIKEQLQSIFGTAFKVETRFEQNKTLYLVMRTEKWAVYAVLLLVLIIASFNMVGALSLLVLEKQKDMAILKAMGAEPATIRWIFITEGILWALVGGAIGLIAGTAICAGQQHFKWLKMGGSFIVDAYPVAMQGSDFVLIICTVTTVGLLVSLYPSIRATKIDAPALKSS